MLPRYNMSLLVSFKRGSRNNRWNSFDLCYSTPSLVIEKKKVTYPQKNDLWKKEYKGFALY